MAQRSYPFDGGDGAAITEDQWSKLVGSYQDDGVICDGPWQTDLKVIGDTSASTAWVQPGRAILRGVHFESDTVVPLAFNENTNPSYDRMDLVVLRLDRDANLISFVVKEGQPSPTPVAPNPDVNGPAPEMPLARVLVRHTTTNIGSGDVIDVRPFVGRRVRVGDLPLAYPRGAVVYEPTRDRWSAVRNNAQVEDLAFHSEIAPAVNAGITSHVNASDPHTQYYNQARGDNRYALKNHEHDPVAPDYHRLKIRTTKTYQGTAWVQWETAEYNYGNMWSLLSSEYYVYFSQAGLYAVSFCGDFQGYVAGYTALQIELRNGGQLAEDVVYTTASADHSVRTLYMEREFTPGQGIIFRMYTNNSNHICAPKYATVRRVADPA